MLETTLKNLFDYQRFERSSALQSVIDDTLDRCDRNGSSVLRDEDLAMAAGGAGADYPRESEHDGIGTP